MMAAAGDEDGGGWRGWWWQRIAYDKELLRSVIYDTG